VRRRDGATIQPSGRPVSVVSRTPTWRCTVNSADTSTVARRGENVRGEMLSVAASAWAVTVSAATTTTMRPSRRTAAG